VTSPVRQMNVVWWTVMLYSCVKPVAVPLLQLDPN